MNEHKDIVIIGITGGIGSGKSTIATWVEEAGYPVISSDKLAKELMTSNDEIKLKLINAFGEEIYLQDGSLNKTLMSELIFSQKNSQVSKINQIVHPFVINEIVRIGEDFAIEGKKLIFVESALMYESGMAEGYDYIITVFTNEEKVIERVKKRSGLSEERIRTIMKSQLNPIEKKKLADFVIDNNGTVEQLRSSFDLLLPIIEVLPPNQLEED